MAEDSLGDDLEVDVEAYTDEELKKIQSDAMEILIPSPRDQRHIDLMKKAQAAIQPDKT